MTTVQDLEQQIAERDSLDERLAVARQYEEAQADAVEAAKRTATLALVDAQKILDSAWSQYNEAALAFFPACEDLDEADRAYQAAWNKARSTGAEVPVKSVPLRIPLQSIPRHPQPEEATS